ncbi:hypothetical protein GOP47_0002186 [Adiantum capillus-veneris]|uniref:Uncharacterized protein n=1 Tax=Adiantum capillus-veneris TaxID=13818 RepID=A0A9D4VB88_ADICA|nr:hypothetical protein GOP47_0002186 [Adiantum capillus-veneris]
MLKRRLRNANRQEKFGDAPELSPTMLIPIKQESFAHKLAKKYDEMKLALELQNAESESEPALAVKGESKEEQKGIEDKHSHHQGREFHISFIGLYPRFVEKLQLWCRDGL